MRTVSLPNLSQESEELRLPNGVVIVISHLLGNCFCVMVVFSHRLTNCCCRGGVFQSGELGANGEGPVWHGGFKGVRL